MNNKRTDSSFGFASQSETWLAVTMLATLVILIVPLPTFLLDMFLAFNIAAAIMLLLVVLGARKPLDVSVFPSVLLLLTLFRLSLNVGTTRLILLNADAGKIVLAFGDFVVGGNLIVGVVIFLILVTIQFVVITKGATRISEVNARFTLDAMPGKQMAIDAELSAGAINEVQARERRSQLTSEAEFFGAMDGASKYVRGDAIAGLIIMAVNIVGGVFLGISQGQAVGDALQVYSILTIGDGLVSQIPALIIATSAGVLVTKSGSESNLGDEIGNQFKKGYRSLYVGSIILILIAFTPGFPRIPFIAIGAAVMFFVQHSRKNESVGTSGSTQNQVAAEDEDSPELSPETKTLNEFLQSDRIIIEIGAGLISMVEPRKGTGVAARIGKLRENMASQYGFWIPQARVRDNLQMGVHDYRFLVCGREIGKGSLMLDRKLAINPGEVKVEFEGITTVDPAFDLPAIWIEDTNRRRAEAVGYTVVDAQTVLITHLGECLRSVSHELLSREDMQKMLDKLREFAPTTVDDIKSDVHRLGQLHQVLVNLLQEGIPITSLEKIVESAIYFGAQTKSVTELTEKIRAAIGHLICDPFKNESGLVRVLIFEPRLEQFLRQSLNDNSITLSPACLERMVTTVSTAWQASKIRNEPIAVLVDSTIRNPLRLAIQRSLPSVSVIAYNEIPHSVLIDTKVVVRFAEVVKEGDAQDSELLMEQVTSKSLQA